MKFSRSTLNCAILTIFYMPIYASATTQAVDEPAENTAKVDLTTIYLTAEKDHGVGKTIYTQEDIERIPNSSKNITNFLKVNPNVQFDNNTQSALQQGDLKPAEISINGGLPYDNKFLVNGMSINNNINPVGANSSNSPDSLFGNSQIVAVNTDLLCNITVLDSNISAEYGEFTGGVVSAETCKPKTPVGEIHGNINYDYTSDSWSKVNFPNKEDLEDFEDSTNESQQPYFTKQGVSGSVYGNLTESLGVNVFGSYRNSKIPLKTTLNNPTTFDQKRESTNAGIELFYTPSDHTSLKIGTQFFKDEGLYFKPNIKDSESTQVNNSQSFYINLKNQLQHSLLTQQLSYQQQDAQRNTAANTYVWTKSPDKNWSTSGTSQQQGNLGDLKQEETKLEYSIKAEFTPIITNRISHQFTFGGGYGHYDASSTRPENNSAYTSMVNTKSCLVNGIVLDGCDPSNNKLFSKRTTYYANDIRLAQDRWHAFLQDTINFDQYITSTIGFRIDYDSLTKNNNVAPRTSFTYRPLGNSSIQFTTGWNRYYGLNAFANELSDRLDQYQIREIRVTNTNDWERDPTYLGATAVYRSQLNTPYSDETMFAIQSEFKNTNIILKWVNRDNKDQLRQTALVKDPTITGNTTQYSKSYDNSGRSESDIYTISINNIEPLNFKGSLHRFSLAADYTNTTRNFDSYADTAYSGTPEVIYDGQKIDAEFIPASNFNTPWTIRTGWDIAFANVPLKISNFLVYKSEIDAMKKKSKGFTDENGVYDVYTPYETKATFRWDMRTTYEINLGKDVNSILGLTINNVTNRNNTYVNSNGIAQPEIGRQFIADITFKF
jgi:hypothetical protein